MTIVFKLFMGWELTPELHQNLNQNSGWKQASFIKNETSDDLIECRHQDKNYVGRYLAYSTLTLAEIKKLAKAMHQQLSSYCPNLNVDPSAVNVFPQVFVA
jgi:hypothetical protein